MNNKGFLQIKLLTIILGIGIICFSIPSGVSYYRNVKNERYVQIVKKYINEVKSSINESKYKQLPKENEALLVKFQDTVLNIKSPYGAFKNDYSYVIVLNKGEYYDYYIACIDSTNRGIPIVNEKEINKDSIVYGISNLTSINKVTNIDSLYISDILFEKSDISKENDKNILLVPVSTTSLVSVPYEFKADVHKIYDKIVKNIDTNIYNKEVTINNGVIKYNNEVLSNQYAKDINGFFRYISFPDGDEKKYYSSFINYNKSYVAGVINESNDYTSSAIVFDSRPSVVMNKSATVVEDNNTKYLMWNMMAIYPDNSNYKITECGALLLKNNNATSVNINLDTSGVLIGKSNNNCELGNIFAIRKDNIHVNDRFFARGYIKYTDKFGKEYTAYSQDTISALVK